MKYKIAGPESFNKIYYLAQLHLLCCMNIHRTCFNCTYFHTGKFHETPYDRYIYHITVYKMFINADDRTESSMSSLTQLGINNSAK